jgi:hypothetical protein
VRATLLLQLDYTMPRPSQPFSGGVPSHPPRRHGPESPDSAADATRSPHGEIPRPPSLRSAPLAPSVTRHSEVASDDASRRIDLPDAAGTYQMSTRSLHAALTQPQAAGSPIPAAVPFHGDQPESDPAGQQHFVFTPTPRPMYPPPTLTSDEAGLHYHALLLQIAQIHLSMVQNAQHPQHHLHSNEHLASWQQQQQLALQHHQQQHQQLQLLQLLQQHQQQQPFLAPPAVLTPSNEAHSDALLRHHGTYQRPITQMGHFQLHQPIESPARPRDRADIPNVAEFEYTLPTGDVAVGHAAASPVGPSRGPHHVARDTPITVRFAAREGASDNVANEEDRPSNAGLIVERFKTQLCRSYMDGASCAYGYRCMFAHGERELRTVDQNVADHVVDQEAIRDYRRRHFDQLRREEKESAEARRRQRARDRKAKKRERLRQRRRLQRTGDDAGASAQSQGGPVESSPDGEGDDEDARSSSSLQSGPACGALADAMHVTVTIAGLTASAPSGEVANNPLTSSWRTSERASSGFGPFQHNPYQAHPQRGRGSLESSMVSTGTGRGISPSAPSGIGRGDALGRAGSFRGTGGSFPAEAGVRGRASSSASPSGPGLPLSATRSASVHIGAPLHEGVEVSSSFAPSPLFRGSSHPSFTYLHAQASPTWSLPPSGARPRHETYPPADAQK